MASSIVGNSRRDHRLMIHTPRSLSLVCSFYSHCSNHKVLQLLSYKLNVMVKIYENFLHKTLLILLDIEQI